jgi:hypothetical protein
MKTHRKISYFVFYGIVLFLIILLIGWKFYPKSYLQDNTLDFLVVDDCWESYYLDSTLKVVVDSFITIYDVKTGNKLNSIYKPKGFREMIMHPTGKYLAVLDEYELFVINTNENDTSYAHFDYKSVDEFDKDRVEFSKDGKYIFLIDYAEFRISIYSFPDLKLLDSGKYGDYRNDFWWTERNGRIIFKYEVLGMKKYIYQMYFPVTALKLKFSEPVCIDSCIISE